jgi:hypothetical protein
MLNHTLRMMDVNTIIKIELFIGDLHRHIKTLHNEQFGNHYIVTIFTVDRGQGLLSADFNRGRNAKGDLLSFNNFLSTSKDRTVSLYFACHTPLNPETMRGF